MTPQKNWGLCDIAAGADGWHPIEERTKAWAHGIEGYAAVLRTRCDFGCVQWTPKPAIDVTPE